MPQAVAIPQFSEVTDSDSISPNPALAREDNGVDSLSILIVDDEPTIRLLLRAAMEKEGFRVIEARNGVECLSLFNQAQPDIVLLDAVMPEMDGISCCAALQDMADKLSADSEAESVPVLMITSLDDSQSIEQAFAAGATDYVTKPIHWALLRHRVRGLRDSIKRRQADAEIKRSLKEKEALLKEIHHRVKNNLQIISSLLNLQASKIKDKTALACFRESQDRVQLMAMIHEKLYQSDDLGKIELAAYVQDLSSHLLRSYGMDSNRVQLNINIKGIFLEADTAVSCGLIVNELISNSLKYAFLEMSGTEGNAAIAIEADLTDSNHFFIKYQDNGKGLPEDLDIENSTTLGLQLISTLTEQLGGRLTVSTQPAAFKFSQLSLSD